MSDVGDNVLSHLSRRWLTKVKNCVRPFRNKHKTREIISLQLPIRRGEEKEYISYRLINKKKRDIKGLYDRQRTSKSLE